MSDVIRLLPDHIANQIAAGEVIQRPASVVKELVENAIDAGSTSIDVIIKDAGKTLIQVMDNGCGMSEADTRMAFERHATSKLSHADDLFNLKTKGFRGEALASIAAIAHVQLQTCQMNAEYGTKIQIEGSEVKEQEPAVCKVGTSISVKNLFFNVPARRNFLKSDSIEFGHIEEEFIRIALAHPELRFNLIHNEQTVYQLEEGSLRKRVVELFGKAYNDRIVPINEETDLVKIDGFIGKPEFAKKTRGEQYFFVNNRFFKDHFFNHAVVQAYDQLLQSKTHPSYFIFLTINPSEIDVNVHPTKTEIKFEHDKSIYAILKSSVRQSLGKFNIAPSLDFDQENSFDLPWDHLQKPVVEPKIQVNPNYNPFQSTSRSSASSGISQAIKNASFGSSVSSDDWKQFYEIKEEETASEQLALNTGNQTETDIQQFIQKQQLLLFPVSDGLMCLHYKRANERILYEEMLSTFVAKPLHSQQLLFPIEIEVLTSLSNLWNENTLLLNQLGFTWDKQIQDKLVLTGIPEYLEQEQAFSCVTNILEKLSMQVLDKGEFAHEIIASIAQSSSQKNKRYTLESLQHLYDELFKLTEHQYSPTGKKILNILPFQTLLEDF